MKKYWIYAAILVLVLMHIPFLTADPDTEVEMFTRGAWTDEGLYASQAVNFVRTGNLSLTENSTMVRGPLQTVLQIGVFKVFGIGIISNRLITLAFIVLALLILSFLKGYEKLTFLLVPVVFLQFHIFQYSHYGMTEMMSISLIFISLYFLVRYYEDEERKLKWLVFSSLMMFLSYSFKIQFLYVLAIPPLTVFFQEIKIVRTEKNYKKFFSRMLIICGLALFFFGVYMLVWYLPNADFYKYVMLRESGSRFPEKLTQFPGSIRFAFNHLILPFKTKSFIYSFLVFTLIIIILRVLKRIKTTHSVILFFAISWILSESHKLPMTYISIHYIISLFAAMGLLISWGLLQISENFRFGKGYATIILLIFLIPQLVLNIGAFNRRTHDIIKINNYLASYPLEGATVLGPWSPALTWHSDVKTLPVWNHFLNDQSPVQKFKPMIVVSELDESCSDKTYQSQGITLSQISDSVKVVKLWRYDVGIYWIYQDSVR